MPARDIYHDTVKNALIKDGWNITNDPLRLRIGKKDLYIDLGAEQLVYAEKAMVKIAIEIKSFIGASDISELHDAVGQYIVYHDVLSEVQPNRKLYLAIPHAIYLSLLNCPSEHYC